MSLEWYEGNANLDREAWYATIREVAHLTGDVRALAFVERQERFWDLMQRGGLLKGSPKPPPEERAEIHAQLDDLMGIS